MEQLFIAKEKGRSTIRSYVSDPTPLEEKTLGQLFGIFEIESTEQSVGNEIIDLIIHELSTNYYRSESLNVEEAFERALQETNGKVQEIIAHIGEEWLTHASILVGVRHEHHVVLSYVGNAIALMIHHGKVLDLIDTTQTKVQPVEALKLFTTTLAGELYRHATLFFATERVLDYLSREKIKRVVEHHTPQEAIEELYRLLEEDTTNTNFLALILQVDQHAKLVEPTGSLDASHQQKNALDPLDSMAELVGKQYRTEELLSSSLWPNVKKWLRTRGEQETARPRTAEHPRDNVRNENDASLPLRTSRNNRVRGKKNTAFVLRTAMRWLRVFLLAFGRSLQRGLVAGAQFVFSLFSRSTRRRGLGMSSSIMMRRQRRSLPQLLGAGFTRFGRWFSSLTRIQKLFFIVSIVVLLIFAQSVVNRGEEQLAAKEQDQYGTLIADIEKKVNEGKAAILYNNTAHARSLLLEARGMLEQIPSDVQIFRDRGNSFQQAIQEQLQLVNNVVTVNEPQVVLNFATIHPDIQLGKMILLGASIYAFDRNNLSVYRGNLESQGTTVTISKPSGATTLRTASKASPGTGIVLFSDERVALFNPVTEALSDLALGYGDRERNFMDIAAYGVRLYVLDALTNQIYRHQRDGEKFGEGTPWIAQDAASVTEGVSMAIDGNIYVLKNNGNVVKLASGNKDAAFQLEDVDPQLTSAEKIVTDENTNNLYILDRARQRVVVFGKDGKFVKQYTSPRFTDLQDILVDEPNKKLFILNGAQIFQVDLE